MVQTEMKRIRPVHTHTHTYVRVNTQVQICIWMRGCERAKQKFRKKERVKRRKKPISISRMGRTEKCAANKSFHI